MKKWTIVALAAIGALVLSAQPAHAGDMEASLTPYSHSTGAPGQGGEFKVTEFSGSYITPDSAVTTSHDGVSSTGGLFHSFCVERNEYFSGIATYELNDGTVRGGVGGQTSPNYDALDGKTAKLFYMFWTNQWDITTADAGLTDVSYRYAGSGSTARYTDAEDLQLAIWFLEGEISTSALGTADNGKAQDMIDLAGQLTWADLGKGGWSGIGGVKVLNTYAANGTTHKQDMLVVIPLPAGAWMGLAMLAGLAIVSLRRRRQLRSLA